MSKFETINFTIIKVPFLENVDIEEILLSNKISSSEKKLKQITGYLCNDYKVNSLHIMLPKTAHM